MKSLPKLAIAVPIAAVLLLGVLLSSNFAAAAAPTPGVGRVTVSGQEILVGGHKPDAPFFGVVDTTVLAFATQAYINGDKTVAGKGSVFNAPDTGTHVPVTPNDTPDAFWNQYFAQMAHYGVNLVRIGPGDSWGSEIQYNAWLNHHDEYMDLIDCMTYYAEVNGVYLVFVTGGVQHETPFAYGGSGSVFDPKSEAFDNYVKFSRSMMTYLDDENIVAWYDLFNEPDHNGVNEAYWHGDKVKFNTWARALASATAGASTHPRTLGVAGYSNLFGWSQSDFDLSTGKTGFEIAHRHYYASANDPKVFTEPEQWADNDNMPLYWGELANNGEYPLSRYTYGEKTIYANGGQAITSMVLTGTSDYPYKGGVEAKNVVRVDDGPVKVKVQNTDANGASASGGVFTGASSIYGGASAGAIGASGASGSSVIGALGLAAMIGLVMFLYFDRRRLC